MNLPHAELMPFAESKIVLALALVCPNISAILTKDADQNAFVPQIVPPIWLALGLSVRILVPVLAELTPIVRW